MYVYILFCKYFSNSEINLPNEDKLYHSDGHVCKHRENSNCNSVKQISVSSVDA